MRLSPGATRLLGWLRERYEAGETAWTGSYRELRELERNKFRLIHLNELIHYGYLSPETTFYLNDQPLNTSGVRMHEVTSA